MKYKIYDFLRCPEYSCSNQNVGLDYYFNGEDVFLSFSCLNCGSGSLEDDLRWYVKCPNCQGKVDRGVDRIKASIDEGGRVTFKCTECEIEASNYVRTRWDNSDKTPKFEAIYYRS